MYLLIKKSTSKAVIAITPFEIQDKIYNLFTNDTQLMNLFDNPDTDELRNEKFRREGMYLEEITIDKLPFIIFVFLPDGSSTQNYLVNKSLMEISIYTTTRYEAMLIYKEVKRILQSNFEDMQIIVEGQRPSGILGIFKYIIRFKPLVNS